MNLLYRKGFIMTPGQRIKKLRKEYKISQKDLSYDLGYKTYTTVSKWEAGASLPPGKELKKLANYFEVSTDYILGLNNKRTHSSNQLESETTQINLVKQNETDIRLISIPQYILEEDSSHYFVTSVDTDSLNRIIPVGNNIVVLNFAKANNKSLSTGDIIVVKVNEEYKLQHLRMTDSKVYLEPNSYLDGYTTGVLTIEEFNNLEIIGKVIYTFRKFK